VDERDNVFNDVKAKYKGVYPTRCTEDFLVNVATVAADYGIGMWMGSSAKGAGRPPLIGPDNKVWLMWKHFLLHDTVASPGRSVKKVKKEEDMEIPDLEDEDDDTLAEVPAVKSKNRPVPKAAVKSKKIARVPQLLKDKIKHHFEKLISYLEAADFKVPKSVAMDVANTLLFDEVFH
jgi:hypothetical protein